MEEFKITQYYKCFNSGLSFCGRVSILYSGERLFMEYQCALEMNVVASSIITGSGRYDPTAVDSVTVDSTTMK